MLENFDASIASKNGILEHSTIKNKYFFLFYYIKLRVPKTKKHPNQVFFCFLSF